MDLQEMFSNFIPAITTIFQMGYIPSPSEFYELTEEQYKAYQRQSGDMSKPVYAVIPRNYKYLNHSNTIDTATKEEMFKIGEAAVFLHLYVKEGGCESEDSEDVLRFAAGRFPRSITAGTKFERPILKGLKPGETHLSELEEWIDFLASLTGGGTTLEFKIANKDTGKIEEFSFPVEKLR